MDAMSPRPFVASRGQSGFVLIGVVIFVLALTIIGISLYSLSGYEAGFLERSIADEQAFQYALGGIERAKFALTVAPFSLMSVKQILPIENVTAAVAIQAKPGGLDSTGSVMWDPRYPVTIRVTAQVPIADGFAQKRMEATFQPQTVRNFYSQVITERGGLTIGTIVNGKNHSNSVVLNGFVWDGSGQDTLLWMNPLYNGVNSVYHPVILDTVPSPASTSFITAKWPVAQSNPAPFSNVPGPYSWYTLDAGAGSQVAYFSSPSATPPFSLYDQTSVRPVVQVRGLAVWLFPNGVRFNYGLQVLGMGGSVNPDCLVIVADPNGADPGYEDVGVWFFGGLRAEIPVILVTKGRVIIEHVNNPEGRFDDPYAAPNAHSEAVDLSIFAGTASITGPLTGNPYFPYMPLTRQAGGALDMALDQLIAQGALPNMTSASDRKLAFVAGSWRDSLP